MSEAQKSLEIEREKNRHEEAMAKEKRLRMKEARLKTKEARLWKTLQVIVKLFEKDEEEAASTEEESDEEEEVGHFYKGFEDEKMTEITKEELAEMVRKKVAKTSGAGSSAN